MLTLTDILAGLGKALPAGRGQEGFRFPHITHDSREVRPGSLFVARRGEAMDGHAFIAAALTQGARGILAERVVDVAAPLWLLDTRRADMAAAAPEAGAVAYILAADSHKALEQIAAWWRSQLPVDVCGVTGSVGKTSTKEMIAAVLGRTFTILKSERSLNTDVGMALTLLQMTPEHQKAILEMGMYAKGEIAHLCRLARPRLGVVTNVGPTHLERLGTIEAIAEAKAELVDALPGDGVAILNGDDERVRAMAQRTQARVVTFGLTPGLDVWASDVQTQGLEGVSFRLHAAGSVVAVRSTLLGAHNVYTALAAAGAGLALGMAPDEAAAGLSQAPAQLRMVIVQASNGARILNDTYNSAPVSCLAALQLLSEMPGRRVAVLGDMRELGDYTEIGHRQVGAKAAEVVDLLVVVGKLGRIIGEEAAARGLAVDRTFFAVGNSDAIGIVKRLIHPGDTVLVKGSRSLMMEEIVGALAQ
jgi:UDP-N-acetylmuramoyl-tripeptide--D-alanyl-D-alanine ligase